MKQLWRRWWWTLKGVFMAQPKQATAPPALTVCEVFAPDQYNQIDGGDYTLTAGKYAEGLTRDDGTASKSDDVISMQPDGNLQTRPAGTTGAFERCKKTAQGAAFRPQGRDGKTWIVGVASEVPN